MASEVSICNQALIELGVETIISLTEDSQAARLCNQLYAEKRDALLRQYEWSFATGRERLAQLTAAPTFEFAYAYQLPSDYLSIQTTNIPTSAHRIEGDTLVSDESEVYIRYTKQVTDPNAMTSDFRELLALLLAERLYYQLTKDKALGDRIARRVNEFQPRTVSVSAQESVADDIPQGSFLDSRY